MSVGFHGVNSRFIVDGRKLTEARVAAQQSMMDVVKFLADGCPKSSVCRWELERLVPSEERIRKMAELFGTKSFIKANPNYGKKVTRRRGPRVKKVEGEAK